MLAVGGVIIDIFINYYHYCICSCFASFAPSPLKWKLDLGAGIQWESGQPAAWLLPMVLKPGQTGPMSLCPGGSWKRTSQSFSPAERNKFAADGGPGQGETPLTVPGLCRAVPRGRQRLAGSCLDSDGEAGAGEQALPFDVDLASQPWKDLSV